MLTTPFDYLPKHQLIDHRLSQLMAIQTGPLMKAHITKGMLLNTIRPKVHSFYSDLSMI